jgi:hypothetical protein
MNLFGKKKKQNPELILNELNNAVSMLEKREVFLSKQIFELREQAKTALKAKQKTGAIYYMKKCKLLEKQRDNILNTKLNIEIQLCTISQAITNNKVVESIKNGISVMDKVDPEEVERVMESVEENIIQVDEVSQALGRPLQVVDEDELLSEFLDEELSQPIIINAPQVPNTPLTEEQELKQLDALFS